MGEVCVLRLIAGYYAKTWAGNIGSAHNATFGALAIYGQGRTVSSAGN